MLINISDAQVVQPLLQRKSLSPEHLYLYSGKRFTPGSRVAGESLVALETELTQSTVLYLQAQDLCLRNWSVVTRCCPKHWWTKSLKPLCRCSMSWPSAFRHIAVHHFDLAYAYLAWHTSDDYPVMHHMLVALTLDACGYVQQPVFRGRVDVAFESGIDHEHQHADPASPFEGSNRTFNPRSARKPFASTPSKVPTSSSCWV